MEGGYLQVELTYKIAFIGLAKYLNMSTDWMMLCVKKHENNKKLYSIPKKANEYKYDIKLEGKRYDKDLSCTLAAKKFREAVYTKSASRKLGEETIALKVL